MAEPNGKKRFIVAGETVKEIEVLINIARMIGYTLIQEYVTIEPIDFCEEDDMPCCFAAYYNSEQADIDICKAGAESGQPFCLPLLGNTRNFIRGLKIGLNSAQFLPLFQPTTETKPN